MPRYPSITRDLSVEIDDALPAVRVRDTIRAAAGPALVSIKEIDRYQGVLFLAVLAQCVKQIVPAWRRITEPEITGYFAADATGFQIVDSGVPDVVMSDLMLIEFIEIGRGSSRERV